MGQYWGKGQYLVNMYKKGQNSQNLAKLMEIDQKGWKYVKKKLLTINY